MGLASTQVGLFSAGQTGKLGRGRFGLHLLGFFCVSVIGFSARGHS